MTVTPSAKLNVIHMYTLQFVWYHYQDNVRRSTFGNSSRRIIGGHIATKADKDVLDEHKSDVQQQWDVIAQEVSFPLFTAEPHALQVSSNCVLSGSCSQFPDFVPQCTMQETYTGGVAKTVVGSKGYWCYHTIIDAFQYTICVSILKLQQCSQE